VTSSWSLILQLSQCVSKHCIKHDHMCLTLCATCLCVPFIMWNMAMCAIHKMKHVHICLSLHDKYFIARCHVYDYYDPCYHLYTIMYLKQTIFLGYIVLQLFCIYSLCYVWCYFAREICSVPLHQHFPQFVHSAQCGCFLQLLSFALSWYVAQVLSEWYWIGSSHPYYYQYHFCFHIPHALNFCYEVPLL